MWHCSHQAFYFRRPFRQFEEEWGSHQSIMDTIDRIRSIPRYITIAAWIAAAAIALYLISMVKRFVAPNANLIPKGCCTCREEPRLTQETPPTVTYVPQQPGPLTRSASHVSLVVAAEPSRSDEGTFKLSTLPRTLVAPYLRPPYRNIYPETQTGP